ncbi:MAG: FAD-dependent oxidoreductase [Nevskiales bacterium]|nr:FAD-dependent oxidoreductase [Nevskiales bacterium]
MVVGAGFAALTAIRVLRKQGAAHRITMVAPRQDFVYLPSLIWVPTGLREGRDLVVPLWNFLQRHNVQLKLASVVGLDAAARTLKTDQGDVAYDALLIASGGRFLKGLPGADKVMTVCEGVGAAQRIRERLERLDGGSIAFGFGANPKEPAAMRGGPMFELSFGIDTWLRRRGVRDRFKLHFVSAAAEPGKRLGPKAVVGLVGEMKRRGIELHLGHPITAFTDDGVETANGRVEADLTLFMPGMTGPAWAEASGLPLSPGGFFQADAHCRVQGAEAVFVAGDSGSFPGPDWAPKQAHMADLQAKAAAVNILDMLDGKTPQATFRNELVCIVDTLDGGILVYRDSKRAWVIPRLRILHWLKRLFEWWYLRPYRA